MLGGPWGARRRPVTTVDRREEVPRVLFRLLQRALACEGGRYWLWAAVGAAVLLLSS